MKIAFDISPLEGGHSVRGTGIYTSQLKKALLNYAGHHQFIFFTDETGIPKDTDIVHFPYFDPFFLTLPMFLKNKIVTVHDLIPVKFPEYFPSGIRGTVKWNIQRFSLQRCKAIITDSESSKRDIAHIAHISSDKIHVIYLAASDEFKKIQDSKRIRSILDKYSIPKEFLLYVGDATWNKNVKRLVTAAQQTHIPLVIVGKVFSLNPFPNPWNKDLIEVRKIIRQDKSIICLGFIPAQDLAVLYTTAIMLVMPSLYEGFGLPILEAASCGCPVLTSRAGSIPEVIGENALFVDPENSTSITEGIQKLYKDKNLQLKLSEEGIKRSKKFSWRKTAEETIRVYETYCQKK